MVAAQQRADREGRSSQHGCRDLDLLAELGSRIRTFGTELPGAPPPQIAVEVHLEDPVRLVLNGTDQNEVEGVRQQAADAHSDAVGVDGVDLADLRPPACVAVDVDQRAKHTPLWRAKAPQVVEAVCRGHWSAHPDDQREGVDGGGQGEGLTDGVAVDLNGLGAVEADGHRFQTMVVHSFVAFALLGDHPPGHGHPTDHTHRGEDDGVEPAVVDLGPGHEHESAGKPAAVADDNAAHTAAELGFVVDLHPDLELWAAQVLHTG